MKLQASTETYKLSLEEHKIFLAKHLGVDPKTISVKFITKTVGDDRFGPTWEEIDSIEITVDKTERTD